MTKRLFRIRQGEPLFDIVSYGRGALRENRGRLTRAQIEQVRRTVQRAPEVVVKVLPRASNDLKAAGKHLEYIPRYGKLDLETDDGERLCGRVGSVLLDDWDLDIDDVRRQAELVATKGRKPAKLIHKLIFSMPPGTPPDKVLAAVRTLAREEFALKHRYAMVLHTDETHPHVHMVIKAVSEQGVRLNIRKATLRQWRERFAQQLRALGVAANATERALRGQVRPPKIDGIYRAERRGESTHTSERAAALARELLNGGFRVEAGKSKLLQTRKEVERGWRAVGEMLRKQGYVDQAVHVERFIEQMPPPATEKELMAKEVLSQVRDRRLGNPTMIR